MPVAKFNLAELRAEMEARVSWDHIFQESALHPSKPLVEATDSCKLFKTSADTFYGKFQLAESRLEQMIKAGEDFITSGVLVKVEKDTKGIEEATKAVEIARERATSSAKEYMDQRLTAHKLAEKRSGELKDLLSFLTKLVPTEHLKELTDGAALTISPVAREDSVTPGQLLKVVRLQWEYRVIPTVVVGMGQYVSAIQGVTYGKEIEESWKKMLIQLRDLNAFLDGTWAAVRSGQLCAMILDVLKSKGHPLSGLRDAVGGVWKEGFIEYDNRTVQDLLTVLNGNVVRAALALVRDASAAAPKESPKVVAKKAEVQAPSPPRAGLKVDELDTWDKAGKAQCREFKQTGGCRWGAGCRFSHEV